VHRCEAACYQFYSRCWSGLWNTEGARLVSFGHDDTPADSNIHVCIDSIRCLQETNVQVSIVDDEVIWRRTISKSLKVTSFWCNSSSLITSGIDRLAVGLLTELQRQLVLLSIHLVCWSGSFDIRISFIFILFFSIIHNTHFHTYYRSTNLMTKVSYNMTNLHSRNKKLGLIHFTSVSARWRLYRRSVTDLSPHRRTDPGSQRPVLPGGHSSKY